MTDAPLDLDAIQARLNAATPGPWYADGSEIYAGDPDMHTLHAPWVGETCNVDLPDHGDRNATFVAAARTDVEQLVARVRRLEGQLAEMTHCRDNAIRALHRDDIDTDIDVEEAITEALHGPGWDWEDERTPSLIARDVAPEIRPALAKATQQRDEARARVRELEAERALYVGVEPTIAEEMAELTRGYIAAHAVCDAAEKQATRWENPLPVPEWVAAIRAALDGHPAT